MKKALKCKVSLKIVLSKKENLSALDISSEKQKSFYNRIR